jgi:lipopolysaccharide biosynthesis glycosyltransferase
MQYQRGVALVLCASRGFDFAVGTTILSFLDKNSWFSGSIIVYHDGLTVSSQNVLKQIYPLVEFKTFSLSPIKPKWTFSYWRFSKMPLARFEALDLLDSFDILFFSDIDVIFLGSIEHLIHSKYDCGFLSGGTFSSNFLKPIPAELEKFAEIPNASCGFYFIRNNLKNIFKSKQAFLIYQQLCSKLRLPDQGVLNLMIIKAKIQFLSLGEKYASHEVTSRSVILHQSGPNKIWASKHTHFLNYYEKWQALGGEVIGPLFTTKKKARIYVSRVMLYLSRFH